VDTPASEVVGSLRNPLPLLLGAPLRLPARTNDSTVTIVTADQRSIRTSARSEFNSENYGHHFVQSAAGTRVSIVDVVGFAERNSSNQFKPANVGDAEFFASFPRAKHILAFGPSVQFPDATKSEQRRLVITDALIDAAAADVLSRLASQPDQGRAATVATSTSDATVGGGDRSAQRSLPASTRSNPLSLASGPQLMPGASFTMPLALPPFSHDSNALVIAPKYKWCAISGKNTPARYSHCVIADPDDGDLTFSVAELYRVAGAHPDLGAIRESGTDSTLYTESSARDISHVIYYDGKKKQLAVTPALLKQAGMDRLSEVSRSSVHASAPVSPGNSQDQDLPQLQRSTVRMTVGEVHPGALGVGLPASVVADHQLPPPPPPLPEAGMQRERLTARRGKDAGHDAGQPQGLPSSADRATKKVAGSLQSELTAKLDELRSAADAKAAAPVRAAASLEAEPEFGFGFGPDDEDISNASSVPTSADRLALGAHNPATGNPATVAAPAAPKEVVRVTARTHESEDFQFYVFNQPKGAKLVGEGRDVVVAYKKDDRSQVREITLQQLRDAAAVVDSRAAGSAAKNIRALSPGVNPVTREDLQGFSSDASQRNGVLYTFTQRTSSESWEEVVVTIDVFKEALKPLVPVRAMASADPAASATTASRERAGSDPSLNRGTQPPLVSQHSEPGVRGRSGSVLNLEQAHLEQAQPRRPMARTNTLRGNVHVRAALPQGVATIDSLMGESIGKISSEKYQKPTIGVDDIEGLIAAAGYQFNRVEVRVVDATVMHYYADDDGDHSHGESEKTLSSGSFFAQLNESGIVDGQKFSESTLKQLIDYLSARNYIYRVDNTSSVTSFL
jgi:hypothetical protein